MIRINLPDKVFPPIIWSLWGQGEDWFAIPGFFHDHVRCLMLRLRLQDRNLFLIIWSLQCQGYNLFARPCFPFDNRRSLMSRLEFICKTKFFPRYSEVSDVNVRINLLDQVLSLIIWDLWYRGWDLFAISTFPVYNLRISTSRLKFIC